jgi:sarcosine/dimethylglycine N-methyltransferase
VLDAGSGVGGTARYLADQFGCRVAAVDLTEEYCDGRLRAIQGISHAI